MGNRYVVTDYWSDGHRPYTGILHDPETDSCLGRGKAVDDAIEAAGAKCGDEIEIIVRKTGRRPFGDRKVKLARPHEYEREKGS